MDLITILAQKRFHHVFQPLYHLSNHNLLGYEGFFRSDLIANPEEFFSLAKKRNILYKVDTFALSSALLTFSQYSAESNPLIFVNVFPSSVVNPFFFVQIDNLLSQISIPCHKIVFEINEAEKIQNFNLLREVVYSLRDYGFLIAVDDFGKGEDCIQKVIELEPNFIKLDRYFSIDLCTSVQKQKFIEVMINFSKGSSKVILEGIETQEDLNIAKSLGVPIAQGFLLGKPDLIENINKPVHITLR